MSRGIERCGMPVLKRVEFRLGNDRRVVVRGYWPVPEVARLVETLVREFVDDEGDRYENLAFAAREALDYLDQCGPHYLDAGEEESGCDAVTAMLRAALPEAPAPASGVEAEENDE